MKRPFLCRLGFHSWGMRSDAWVKPEENGYQIEYVCKRCELAIKTIEYTDARGFEGRCVATKVEEFRYEE